MDTGIFMVYLKKGRKMHRPDPRLASRSKCDSEARRTINTSDPTIFYNSSKAFCVYRRVKFHFIALPTRFWLIVSLPIACYIILTLAHYVINCLCAVHDISRLKASQTTCWIFGGFVVGNISRACQQLNINVDQHKLYVAMQLSPDSSVVGLFRLRNGRLTLNFNFR